jgi:hypothetical protein
MAITHTRLLQFYQNFGKFYTWQFAPPVGADGAVHAGDECAAVSGQ